MNVRNLTRITFSFVEFYHISKTLEQVPGLSDALASMLEGMQMLLLELEAPSTSWREINESELVVTFPLDVLEELTKIMGLQNRITAEALDLSPAHGYNIADELIIATARAKRIPIDVSSFEVREVVREVVREIHATVGVDIETSGIGPDDEVYPVADATPRNIGQSRF